MIRLDWSGSCSCRRRRAAAALALFVLAIFTGLLQQHGWFLFIDRPLMRAAGAVRETGAGQLLTPLMRAVTLIGDTMGRIVLGLFCCGLLIFRGRMGQALWLAAVIIGGTLLNECLKHLFAAPRPVLIAHLDRVSSYSFPSGHAAGNMVFFGALAIITGGRAAWSMAVSAALLIGVSRIWLGVHWPSDVAAGWFVGLGWLFAAMPFLPRRRTEGNIHASR